MYLASASPRRRALLTQIGVPFAARPAEISETREEAESPADYVVRLAIEKADRIWDSVAASESRPVLAADTAVVLEERVFGKPRDAEDALRMLKALSGRTHEVLTAVALRHESRIVSELCASEVRFRRTTERERRAYVETGEPLDKAGGYAIQGLGAVFVEHLSGSYSAVMGLPLSPTAKLLAQLGLPPWLHAETGSA